MNIDIVFVDNIEGTSEEAAVWEILCACDQDFIPPLSSRENTYQTHNLLGESGSGAPTPLSYFEELKTQCFLLAKDKESERIVGFLSFKHGYVADTLSGYNPSNYVTTTCIPTRYRNQGIGRALYRHVEYQLEERYQLPYITRRTWSTNDNQLHLFRALGYTLVHRITNHRGEGIDTVYFAKKVNGDV